MFFLFPEMLFLLFNDKGFPVVYSSLTGLFPRAHERNSHTRALGKSGAGFEHTTWEANPCLMPIAQLQKSFYI